MSHLDFDSAAKALNRLERVAKERERVFPEG
jgi:hypothetical protein